MSVLGAPTPNVTLAAFVSMEYNIFEHLGKTPTQISILEFLKALPTH